MKRKPVLGLVGLVALVGLAVWLHRREPPNPSRLVARSHRAPRHATTSKSNPPAAVVATAQREADAGLPLRLLRLRVRTPDGPAVGATIFVDDVADATRTDAEGRWSKPLAKTPDGISAQLGELKSPWIGLWQIPDDEIPIDLIESVAITGHLLDAESGEPVAGAKISLPGQSTRSDGAGAFALSAPPNLTRLIINEPHHQRLSLDVPVVAGQPQDLELRLVPSVAVSGQIADTSGEPIPGAEVSVCDPERSTHCKSASASGDGGFTVEGIARGARALEVKAEGFATYTKLVNAPAAGLEVRMARGAEVEGVVFDGQGAPLAGAGVYAEMPLHMGSSHAGHTRTDDHGAFTLILAPGSYELTASAPGLSRSRPLSLELADETYDKVELRLPSGGATAAGQVIDAVTRKPIAGVTVSAAFPHERGALRPEDVETDAQGHFRMSNIAAGSKTLTASIIGYPDLELPVAPQMVFELRHDTAPQIVGRVLGEAGSIFTAFRIDGAFQGSGDGRFAVPIPVGGSSLTFGADGYLDRTVALPPRPSEGNIDLGDIALTPGQLVEVHVFDADGARVPGASVFNIRPPYPTGELSHAARPAGLTDAEGTAHVHLEAGDACLVAAQQDGFWGGAERCPEQVTPGMAPIEVHLPRPGWIAGHVYRDGAPTAGARVVIAANGEHTALTDADGAYRLGPLHAGKVPVMALDGNDSFASMLFKVRLVSVEPGETSTRDFGSPDTGRVEVAIIAPPDVTRVLVAVLPGPVGTRSPEPPDGTSARSVQLVNGRGTVTLDDVLPGAARIQADDLEKTLPRVERPFEMPAGGVVREVLTLTR